MFVCVARFVSRGDECDALCPSCGVSRDVVMLLRSHDSRPERLNVGRTRVVLYVVRPMVKRMYVWLRVFKFLLSYEAACPAFSAGRTGLTFCVLVCVSTFVSRYSCACLLHAIAIVVPTITMRRGGVLRVPVAREFRGPLVIPVSPLSYFACCCVKVYGICVGWDPGGEAEACRGSIWAGVCRYADCRDGSCGVVMPQRIA